MCSTAHEAEDIGDGDGFRVLLFDMFCFYWGYDTLLVHSKVSLFLFPQFAVVSLWYTTYGVSWVGSWFYLLFLFMVDCLVILNVNLVTFAETLSMKGLTLNCMDRKSEAYELVRIGLKVRMLLLTLLIF